MVSEAGSMETFKGHILFLLSDLVRNGKRGNTSRMNHMKVPKIGNSSTLKEKKQFNMV